MKIGYGLACILFGLSSSVFAAPPYIEHTTGFFSEGIPLQQCLQTGREKFTDLGITIKKSTNPKNEVVGFNGNYKIVLYCVSEEGGCDAPEQPYAYGGTVIVAGPKYATVKAWVEKVQTKMRLK